MGAVSNLDAWSAERVEQLKALLEQGFSASQIAAKIGGISRNAVLGKVHRLGLVGRKKPSTAKAQRREVVEAAPAFALTQENMKHLAELRSNGKSVFEIARAFSCSLLSVRIAIRSLGNPVEKPIAVIDDDNLGVSILSATEVEEIGKRARTIFSQRKSTECAWIFGDPAADAPICGDLVPGLGSYCNYHHKLVFVKYERRAS